MAPSRKDKDTPKEGTERAFDDLVDRLETIVENLEGGEMRLERSLELFEEGVRLSREASRRLDAAERRIEELLEDGTTKPLAEPAEDE